MKPGDRIAQMIADPDLTGDTLLFAICLHDLLWRRKTDPAYRLRTNTNGAALREITKTATGREDKRLWWVRDIIRDDVPRYDIDPPHTVRCGAPMIRRASVCGKATSATWMDRDPVTGEKRWVGFCNRHRSHDRESERRERHERWQANGKPEPAPNRGGVLPRYFKTDWSEWWGWAAPGLTPSSGEREAGLPRPVFTLIQGGAE
ncbi:hypothetical protein RHRU231_450116 [Rhodococcus ruber]|uniref:Uncharacterized protein n=1 Tax=Rhodococcus ruber TaxID=1830 RepID=A0A098BJM3_9NOCA|nr:hypothetical protein RHRU231_450116 [Rhodococcus ruber]